MSIYNHSVLICLIDSAVLIVYFEMTVILKIHTKFEWTRRFRFLMYTFRFERYIFMIYVRAVAYIWGRGVPGLDPSLSSEIKKCTSEFKFIIS